MLEFSTRVQGRNLGGGGGVARPPHLTLRLKARLRGLILKGAPLPVFYAEWMTRPT